RAALRVPPRNASVVRPAGRRRNPARDRVSRSLAPLVTKLILLAAAAALATAGPAHPHARPATPPRSVRVGPIRYTAHDGRLRRAWVQLPRWYGASDHPRIPLIISLHGRG